MSGAPKPPVIPEPFANDADPLYITAIPDTTGVSGRASYSLGFPPLTMQPVAGGGKPPFGQDMNGILNALSAHDFYAQAGQFWPYDAAVASAIGGYALGAIVLSSDGNSLWRNVVNGNVTNPDDDTTGTGWAPAGAGVGIPPIGPGGVITGGTFTMPASIARYGIFSINGTLTSNLTVVMPSGAAWTGTRWLVINNTAGAFTTTVRTGAGTGIIIPQGGLSNPVGVYGDGSNIYATTPAASLIPADQAASPLTLAERDNLAQLSATKFIQTSGNENPTVLGVFVTNNTDGQVSRKIVLPNLQAQMLLSAFAGQVAAGQVPLAAVIQYVTNILASAALTGTPTTPTAAPGSTGSQVASLSFANPARSSANPGFFKTAGGDIVCRGTLHIGDIVAPVGGFIAFPTSYTSPPVVTVSLFDANNGGATCICTVENAITTAGFNWAAREIASFAQNATLEWQAVGF